MNERPVYVHYGAEKFDKALVKPIKNDPHFSKPIGGFWCCREDAEYGWVDWCKDEEYKLNRLKKSFKFHIKENANVIRIHTMEDIKTLCDGTTQQRLFSKKFYFDFESMVNRGVDAIELCVIPCVGSDMEFWDTMYGWDCESMVIFNPDIIEVIK